MKYEFDIIVIGAGSAGLVVASGSAALGAKVLLIEEDLMGGDCLNTGCVPSKSFLKGAHIAKDISNLDLFGIDVAKSEVSISQLMERVHSVIESIKPHDSVERYESLGVTVKLGHASLVSPNHVKVNDTIISSKKIVIATGSKAFVPNIKGIDRVDYLTNKNIFELKTMPKHLIVLGAGPIGLELGQGFKHIGVNVTIIDHNPHLFNKDDSEVGPLMESVFIKDGVNLQLSSKILEVIQKDQEIHVLIEKDNQQKWIIGDKLLVSLGRAPVTENLGIKEIGIKLDSRGYIITDKKLRTNIKGVYACGDITGPYQFTHMAGYQAGLVIRNSLFNLSSKLNYTAVPWTTYTKPEVAHVGYTEATAIKENIFHKSIIVNLEDMDRAKAENDTVGFLKLILNKKSQLVGATLVGEKAGEMIPLATLAITQKLKPNIFMNMIFSYPTEAEIFKFAALKHLKESVKPWQTNLIKKIFFS